MNPLDSRTREGRMTFAELGEEFMRLVLSSELLVKEFKAAIPPGGLEATETVDGFTVEYRAQVTNVAAKRNGVTRLHPQPAIHGYRFHFTATFSLSLTINIIGGLKEVFDMAGTIPITLEAQAYRPLELYVSYEKLKEEQIELSIVAGQWHDLARRFGGLEEKAKRKIVDRVNTILAGNEGRRTVNLLDMINNAVAARGQAKG